MKEWRDNWGNYFWLQLEKYGEMGRDKKCSGYNAPSLFRNLQRVLWHVRSVALSKDVTHYGSRSRFPYYNPALKGLLLSSTHGRTEELCGFESWESSSVASKFCGH